MVMMYVKKERKQIYWSRNWNGKFFWKFPDWNSSYWRILFSDNYSKFKTKSFNLPDQFKEFVELFKKAATPAINKSTKLKLVGNKEGRPRLPYFARINKEGDGK